MAEGEGRGGAIDEGPKPGMPYGGIGWGGFRAGQLFGIQIRVDWSLLVIFWLLVFTLGAGFFPSRHPEWSTWMSWGLAVVAAILFVFSVLAHELSHALVGRAVGVPVDRITLFIFGGLANTEREPPTPGSELLTALVGPMSSIVIGILATTAGAALMPRAPALLVPEPLRIMSAMGPGAMLLLWLGPINILLGVFNLVPGFPLDGGRVLRAALWAATGNLRKATRAASGVGQGFGLLLVALGVAMIFGVRVPFFGQGLIQGLWIAFIGWFLHGTARLGYREVVVRELLKDVPVADLMRRAPAVIPPTMRVDELVDELVMPTDQRAFPVVEGGRLAGLVCLQDLRKVPREEWAATPVSAIMTPAERLAVTLPGESVAEALRKLTGTDVDQVPVVEGSALRGMLRRSDIIRWLEIQPKG